MQKYGADRSWPFAEGGEATLALASGIWLFVALLARIWPHFLTRILLFLVTPVWLLILYFFRDPNRPLPREEGLVVSAADGEVVAIAREREERMLQRDVIRVSTFLSITDVHVQRAPVTGVVREVLHRPGAFLQAFRPEASEQNDSISMIIDTPGGPVLVRQIAGIMARRCVNHAQPGDELKAGQRFGLIKFGSRVDLFLPPTADILCVVGSKVTGGVTPIAQLTVEGGAGDAEQ